ncbi:DnaJ-domain-containing protein [Xylariaceae sp. FL0662B]|nr:DnaJ-domain-containing protein [Xylariaceae sp. FL0662B]
MSSSFDPYKTLGVSKDAQLPEIRSAHRKLVLKCHPDKIQDPKLKEEKQKEFQQVQQAYELLSNETERSRYDDKVKLEDELRKRDSPVYQTSASSRSKRQGTAYNVYEPEPRPSTFASSPASHNVYGHTPPSRSWEDDLHSSRRFEEAPRYARKAASYEKEREKPSRREEERRRRRDREREEEEFDRERERIERDRAEQRAREKAREKEREKEREKLEKEAARERKEKERRKEEKKLREKDRKEKIDEKSRRHKAPYVETYPEDQYEEVIYSSASKSDKKKSNSSRKYEEPPPPPPPRESSRPPTTERERKNSANMEFAFEYLTKSGGKAPTLTRAQTFQDESHSANYISPPVVPTPPPATASAYPPPPIRDALVEEEAGRRSSTRTRRPSHDTPRLSKEKSSHKKSNSSREPVSPVVIDASPTTHTIPSFQKSHTAPNGMSDAFRTPLSRANTENVSRPPIVPSMERSQTWSSKPKRGHERSRSRQARPVYLEEESEDERDRRHRRSTRRTRSPEVMASQTKYTVTEGKAIPVSHGYTDSPRTSKRTAYPVAHGSAHVIHVGDPDYYEDYDELKTSWEPHIKYAAQFEPDEIAYSKIPHSSYRGEVYT